MHEIVVTFAVIEEDEDFSQYVGTRVYRFDFEEQKGYNVDETIKNIVRTIGNLPGVLDTELLGAIRT